MTRWQETAQTGRHGKKRLGQILLTIRDEIHNDVLPDSTLGRLNSQSP